MQVRSAGQVRFAVGLDVGTSVKSVTSVTSEVVAPNNTAASGLHGWKAEWKAAAAGEEVAAVEAEGAEVTAFTAEGAEVAAVTAEGT